MIMLTQKEYDDLISDRDKLRALEGAGVDNWNGYDEAMNIFYSIPNTQQTAPEYPEQPEVYMDVEQHY